ncbi:MAG: hypothetical protein IKV10_00895, partial [Alphaproteobacteria bacterium]|nr:hypothetical protein [Alphaproteobacteria bacterium]
AGEFTVDWGDGTIETINKTNTDNKMYHHVYGTAGAYTIGLSGQATAYNPSVTVAAISFNTSSVYNTQKIASIDGSLGAIFGTLSSGAQKQPRFFGTFRNATNMTSIPAKLFTGISGAPAPYMFAFTFDGCSGLTGAIPDGLFAGISGAPADHMFSSTFSGCSGLTSIPENLFAGISGAPASYMFNCTFYGCSGLTSIPDGLFGDLSGTSNSSMFAYTFSHCSGLTGPSARINGKYLYEIWPDAMRGAVGGMYYNATGLSDYSNIPDEWKDDLW